MSTRTHPFADWMGLSVEAMEKGHARCALTAGERHLNPNGVVHGAVLYALADTAMGGALYSTLPPEEYGATQQVQVIYLAPARPGPLTAEARLLHRTGRLAVLEAVVSQGERVLARVLGTYVVLRRSETGP